MSDTEASEGIQGEVSTSAPNMSTSNASTPSTSTQSTSTPSTSTPSTSRSHLRVSPPGPLCVASNIAENWKLWKQMWDNYAILTGLDTHPMQYQVALFLHSIGPDALKIYNGMGVAAAEAGDLKAIMKKFDDFSIGELNETYERYVFNNRSQREGESIEAFATSLRNLARTCGFCDCLHDSLIKDRIVTGILDDETRQTLLQERKLDINKCIDICKGVEAAKVRVKTMAGSADSQVNRIQAPKSTKQKRSTHHKRHTGGPKIACKYCGGMHEHKKEKCPAYGKSCKKCGKQNHFAKVCQQTKGRVHQIADECSSSESEYELISSVAQETSINRCEVTTHGVFAKLLLEKQAIRFQVDTGAETNLVSQEYVKHLEISPTSKRLLMWNRSSVNPIGTCIAKIVNPKDNKKYKVSFTVVPNEPKLTPIIGITAAEHMKLVTINSENFQRVHSVRAPLLDDYSDVFHESKLGMLPGVVKLYTDKSVTPSIASSRRVPTALKAKLSEELNRLVNTQVIAKVSEPTDWVSNLVVTTKKSGDIRICIDPKQLNKALKRHHYQSPTLEELLPELTKARVFSTCDLKSGYHHLKLDEESSKLTTFITPHGRYRYLRLPFGLNVSSEIFQSRLNEALEGLEGVLCIADDILIYGCGDNVEEAEKDHDNKLKAFLNRCRDTGIVLNKRKLKLRCSEVPFFGHRLTKDGLMADDEKTKAILQMPRPQCIEDVKRLNGLASYLAKFLPSLSTVSEPLRKLSNSGSWSWMEEHETALHNLKTLASNTPVLRYFDPKSPIVIQCDASSQGLGTCLLQKGQPVSFASRALTKTEQKWAQIEKELLAVVFSMERFHQYIFGLPVTVHSDHKPLETICNKSLLKAPRRLQSLLLRLQAYNVTIIHVPGSKLLLADTLSRAYLPNTSEASDEAESINMIQSLPITKDRLKQIQFETEKDTTLQQLKATIMEGWPNEKQHVNPCIFAYYHFRDELTVQDGLIFRGERVVIPASLRTSMKQRIHTSHLGIEGCLRRAREALFWPGMSGDIKEYISTCEICRRYDVQQQPETLLPTEISDRPWQKIGVDLFYFNGQDYMVTVDYYSNFIEVDHLSSTSSQAVIKKLKTHFSRYGIPDKVVSDNGPQFACHDFKAFSKRWEFDHLTSSPYHPKGNGKAESAVKTAKRLLKKCRDAGQSFEMALLDHHNTPTPATGLSPVQLMMSRRTKTLLPTSNNLLFPSPSNVHYKEKQTANKRKQAHYYNRRAKPLSQLTEGQNVRVRSKPGAASWEKGTVTRVLPYHSYEVDIGGREIRRNRVQIRDSPGAHLTLDDPNNKGQVNGDQNMSKESQDMSSPKRVITPTEGPANNQPIRTKSGRVVRPPQYLKDYSM